MQVNQYQNGSYLENNEFFYLENSNVVEEKIEQSKKRVKLNDTFDGIVLLSTIKEDVLPDSSLTQIHRKIENLQTVVSSLKDEFASFKENTIAEQKELKQELQSIKKTLQTMVDLFKKRRESNTFQSEKNQSDQPSQHIQSQQLQTPETLQIRSVQMPLRPLNNENRMDNQHFQNVQQTQNDENQPQTILDRFKFTRDKAKPSSERLELSEIAREKLNQVLQQKLRQPQPIDYDLTKSFAEAFKFESESSEKAIEKYKEILNQVPNYRPALSRLEILNKESKL